jgi:hypothetical protein
MSILISKQFQGGKIQTCDENCYDSEDKRCDCICSGVNHGVGYFLAIAHTYTDYRFLLAQGCEIHLTQHQLKKINRTNQISIISVP